MANDIKVKHIRILEGTEGYYIVDIVVNGVEVNGLRVNIANNGIYTEAFFKTPSVDDGFGVPTPSVDFPCDMDVEIRMRLKEEIVCKRGLFHEKERS